ncbi:MAG TPA: hypothetical protein EYQ42_00085 [Thiotrichaceae bacterium]|jgi:hypothetical protein|nr:hypothetical protein [Thiotrichaceae bacterium]HIK68236.1 hypothetical protein [Flavobacteriales bacterium]
MDKSPNLKTVSQFTESNPAFTLGGLRWQIFNEDENGLKEAGAIIRIGRKVLIDVDRYFYWVYSQNKSRDIAKEADL